MLENDTLIDVMYSKKPSYVYGFHGCDQKTFENIIHHNMPFQKSTNSYDWLGNGIYFWENNYQRAVEWAKNKYGENAAVIGAVIDLGKCLDTTDYACAQFFKNAYCILKAQYDILGEKMPTNRKGRFSEDLLIRDLDCMVIETIHKILADNTSEEKPYDSVRGTFEEGDEMYPGSGFKEKTHTQICVVNPNCIKACFVPRSANDKYIIP